MADKLRESIDPINDASPQLFKSLGALGPAGETVYAPVVAIHDGGYTITIDGSVTATDATTPWSCTGFKTADVAVKAAAGVFAGILVTATDAGGDIDVIVYDSPTSDLTGDIAVARVTIPTTVANTQGSFGDLSGPGIVMAKGIWVDVVAGDCQFLVYYK